MGIINTLLGTKLFFGEIRQLVFCLPLLRVLVKKIDSKESRKAADISLVVLKNCLARGYITPDEFFEEYLIECFPRFMSPEASAMTVAQIVSHVAVTSFHRRKLFEHCEVLLALADFLTQHLSAEVCFDLTNGVVRVRGDPGTGKGDNGIRGAVQVSGQEGQDPRRARPIRQPSDSRHGAGRGQFVTPEDITEMM